MRVLIMKTRATSLLACISGVALVLALFVIAPDAQALPTNNFLDQVVSTYQSKTSAWEGVLRNYALRLFWILAAIEFTWSAIKLAIKGADISEFLPSLSIGLCTLACFWRCC